MQRQLLECSLFFFILIIMRFVDLLIFKIELKNEMIFKIEFFFLFINFLT